MLLFKEVVLLLATGICFVFGEQTVNLVLVGATGDLSKKYLWRSLADVSRDRSELRIFGGARSAENVGRGVIDDILNASYYEDSFKKRVSYVQLKNCQDYEKLCRDLEGEDEGKGYCHGGEKVGCLSGGAEKGRLFYLSIPPFSYPEVVDCISRHCKPRDETSTWLRIVLEKPFGHDSLSVRSLVDNLLANFKDHQLFPVDHYLGKAAVRAILPFRMLNRDWLEPLMNADHVQRVDIVVTEQDDVKGRVSYYDRYGALLDMVQNHLMEVLQALTSDLPDGIPTPGSLVEEKLRVLRQVDRVQPTQVLLGQHDKYAGYAKEELRHPDWKGNSNTLAAARVTLSNSRWDSVPFVLLAAKAMPFRTAYVKVTFKPLTLCLGLWHRCPSVSDASPEMTFEINPEGGGRPTIRVSREILGEDSLKMPPSWELVPEGQGTASVLEHVGEDRPYTLILNDALDGRREYFVPTENLLASWAIWDDVIGALGDREVPLYPPGSVRELGIRGRGIDLPRFPVAKERDTLRPGRFSLPFRGEGTVLPAEHLYDRLARDLIHAANEAIASRGVFHAAVPGGSTPIPLFRILRSVSLEMGFSKWAAVHVWLTDERCVPYDHPDSNFRSVSEALLGTVRVPLYNSHPMSVELSKGSCHPGDEGALAYERTMKRVIPDARLDYVLLGVGSDGHVASLFPGEVENDGALVALTRKDTESRRMSLTMEAINAARQVSIAVVGEGKRDVMAKICLGTGTADDLPVRRVNPEKSARWFVDDKAFEGAGCSTS